MYPTSPDDLQITINFSGGLAIAVPGEVMGLYTGWQKYGKVDWNLLLEPSVQLLYSGYPVSASLAGAVDDKEDEIRADPNLRYGEMKS